MSSADLSSELGRRVCPLSFNRVPLGASKPTGPLSLAHPPPTVAQADALTRLSSLYLPLSDTINAQLRGGPQPDCSTWSFSKSNCNPDLSCLPNATVRGRASFGAKHQDSERGSLQAKNGAHLRPSAPFPPPRCTCCSRCSRDRSISRSRRALVAGRRGGRVIWLALVSAGMAGRGAWTDGTQGPGRQRIAALLLHGPFERLAGADSNKSPEHNSNLAMPRFRHVQILFCGNASMLKRQISNVKAEMAGLQYRPVEMPKQIREPQAALCRGSHPPARRPGIEHTTALRLPGLEHTTASRPPGLEQTTALRPPGLEHSTALHISAPPRREKITFRLCAKCFVTRSLFVAP